MKKNLKNILIGTGIATVGVAFLATIYNYSTKYLMKLALDREEPQNTAKNKEKLMASNKEVEILKNIANAATQLEAIKMEQIEIKSFDGVKLIGHWYCPKNPKRIIIAMHGWRSKWSQDFGTIAPFWHENDCAVLYAEQRGQGNSGGDYMAFGLLERYDCYDWINWVNEKTQSRFPIYLGGISMGGTTVLMTAGFKLPENVKGIAADCAFTSPDQIWKHVVENQLHLPYGLYNVVAKELCKKKIQVGSDAYSTIEAMEKCTVPVLFIHGSDDRFVPIKMTYDNYKACASKKQLLVVPGAGHGMSYIINKQAYERAVLEFWEQYDSMK